MRGLIGSVLAAAICLGGCSRPAPRPELPSKDYDTWAYTFATIEVCYSNGYLSADDAVGLRRTTNANLSRYRYDSAAVNAKYAAMIPQQRASEASPAVRNKLAQNCATYRQQAATNRATEAQNRAAQLHQAQLAAAQSQIRAAQDASWQPAPFVMPNIPSYQPPVVQTPTLRSGANFYSCRRHSSYVVSCQ